MHRRGWVVPLQAGCYVLGIHNVVIVAKFHGWDGERCISWGIGWNTVSLLGTGL
jgi:hypothetical protein